jgi:uncharacterized protein (TIGR02284 family)
MKDQAEIIEELNDVVKKNYDALNGYLKAAENVNNGSLKSFFNNQANQRRTFINELQSEVRTLGGEPATDGTFQGSVHRSWIDFKSALSANNEESVLEACITGEKNCIGEYNDILEESGLPTSTRNVLERQKSSVQSALNQVQAKEERWD